MPCSGNAEDHCCYNGRGEPCKFLITDYTDETGYFRKYACGLRAELGDWDLVITDRRYIEEHTWAEGLNCRDWPDGEGVNRGVCKECGVNV